MSDDDKPGVSEKDVVDSDHADGSPEAGAKGSHSVLKSRHLYMIATGGKETSS